MTEDKIHKLLQKAQETYGYANQIAVAIEELCELGAVLSKYPRYNYHDDALDNLRDHVVEETADVIIVLRHVQMIFGIQPDELENMMDKKLNRLQRWLEDDDKSFQHTTEDRAIGVCSKGEDEPCSFPECDHSCGYVGDDNKSFQHTTEDRAVETKTVCKKHPGCCPPDCYGWEHLDYCKEHCEVKPE